MTLCGFLPTAVLLCVWDTQYFGGTQWQLTPLNNLLYNLDTNSLAIHGIHPRCTHGLVNIWLLFGWLPLLAVRRMWRNTQCRVLAACCLCGLSVLSMAPHQEPRFLLPLVAPLVVLAAPHRPRGGVQLTLWLTLHAICTFLFGFTHQSGVVPAVAHLADQSATRTVFYKTYPAPQGLLGGGSSLVAVGSDVEAAIEHLRNSSVLVMPGCIPLSRLQLLEGKPC